MKKEKKTPRPEETEVKEPAEQPADETQNETDPVLQEEPDPIEELNKEITELNKQLEDSKNSLLRAYADTDNTRKRLLRDAEQAKKYRFQSAALELLPILDNLNRALAAKPDIPEIENYVRGFEMIQTQLVNALTNEGVEEIDALNQPFDANYMQALASEHKEGVEPGTVTEVMQKGYKLKDRLLRPALVKVSD